MLTVTVTADHIERGMPFLCTACPVAMAIEDALGDRCNYSPSVYPHTLILWADGGRTVIPTPDPVRAFVESYDDGRSVQPFTFTLPL